MRRLFILPLTSLLLSYSWIMLNQGNLLIRNIGLNIIFILSAVVCLIIFLQNSLSFPKKDRQFWLYYAFGTTCYIIAQLFWCFSQLHQTQLSIYLSNWADFFWLLQYLLYLSALIYQLTLIRGSLGRSSLFNVIVLMAMAALLGYHFLIEPIFQQYKEIRLMIIALVYLIFDLGFLFSILMLYFHSHRVVHRRVLTLVTTGLLIQISADLLNYIYKLSNKYEPGGFIEPLWLAPLLLNAVAGLYARRNPHKSWAEHQLNMLMEKVSTLFPLVSVFILMCVILYQDEQVNVLEIGLFLVMLFISVIQIYIIWTNRKLIQEIQLKNEELEESELRYRQLVEISPFAITVEIEGRIAYVNKAGLEIIGATRPEEVMGLEITGLLNKDYKDLVHWRHRLAETRQSALEPYEFEVNRLDGSKIFLESLLTKIKYAGRQGYLIVAQDVTNRKISEERIKNMAYYDELTGLPNRAKFFEDLRIQLELACETDSPLAVLFMDLDRFKWINDSMGHTTGDIYLQKVAQRLNGTDSLRGNIYRLGGDEFCLIQNPGNRNGATAIAGEIIEVLSEGITIQGKNYFTSPSIGISTYPADAAQPEDLVRLADIAMYSAKRHGGNNYRFYTPELDAENSLKLQMEKELRMAVERREFILYYQPKVLLSSGKITGFEVLIRWDHPERGIVSPVEFIPAAEESGLIVPIGQWVLREACSQLKQWHDEGFNHLTIAVNLSPRQFKDANLISCVEKVLRDTGLASGFLEIEVTETAMHNLREASEVLQELKTKGVHISVDDFGTGYSSLSYLKHLPIDYLKIDKSFITDISEDGMDEGIVRAIIEMGRHMNIGVIAEGIEDEEQLRLLRKLHCSMGQGYLFSKPLTAEKARRLLEGE